MTTIPDGLKEIVTFIFVEDGSGNLQANGTGFFVGVQDKTNKERAFVYLVTAKHVVLDSQGQYYPRVFARLNTIAGGSQCLPIAFSGPGAAEVLTHSDGSVDIAVLRLAPRADIHQFKLLPEDMIATRE